MLPLHGGHESPEDANFLQRFIDSDAGNVTGTFSHTFGALLFTAGIALYLYQAHLVNAARSINMMPSLHLLPWAHGTNLLGIGFNGLGGLMRLYQSDHPRIDQLGTSAWVQLLFVKHIFLILGVGMAVFLTYRTHVLSLRDDAPTVFLGETRRMKGFAYGSFVTILLASVLGAFATTQTLPTAADAAEGMAGDDHDAMGHAAAILYDNDTGVVTASPLSPAREKSEIDVPEGATQLFVELVWTNPQSAALRLEVQDPQGHVVEGKITNAAGRVVYELSGTLASGAWSAYVLSEQAVNERYSLVGRVTVGSPTFQVLEETYTVNADPTGRGARFVEINLKMKLNQTIRFSWQVLGSSEKVNFNVHTHIGGRTEYPVQGTWNSYSGNYTHNSKETDGVSLMWTNPTATPLQIRYRLEGDYAVDSRVVR